MNKKSITAWMMAILMLLTMSVSVFADGSRSYEIDLTVNGSHEVQAKAGDILTVTMTLKRTDSNEAAMMYAMQDEIRYDPDFLELVDGSTLMMNGIEVTDIGLIDDYRAFYVNFLSLGGGEEWKADTMLGSFQVKVLGEQGSSMMKNENCMVSTQDGSDSYALTVNDLLVIVSSECVVRFDSMGGSDVEEQIVRFGEKIRKPAAPSREGYTFDGWYSDIYLKNPWDFENDTVKDNMTLYAAWQEGAPAEGGFSLLWLLLLLIAILVLIIFWLLRKKKKAD